MTKQILIISTLLLVNTSCNIKQSEIVTQRETEDVNKHPCGYELSNEESMEISTWILYHPNPFELSNSTDVFLEIRDSFDIIHNLDSIDFMLKKMTTDEICIDIYTKEKKTTSLDS